MGGSLGTLIALMLCRRGVLPLSRLATLYTFGAPAVFYEEGGEAVAPLAGGGGAGGGSRGVLGSMGLPDRCGPCCVFGRGVGWAGAADGGWRGVWGVCVRRAGWGGEGCV